MRRRIPLLLAVPAVLAALAAGPARGEDPAFAERVANVKKALRSDDPKVKARAFDPLRETDDPRAVDVVIEGVGTVWAEQDKIRKEQVLAEQAYEKTLDDQEKNRQQFERSAKSSKDMDRYNANERKIAKVVESSLVRLRDLENDFLRTRALLDNATGALGRVLEKVPTEALMPSLAKIEAAWLRSKRPEDPILFVDAIAALDRPWVGEKLRAVARDAAVPQGVRGAALVTLGGRKDPATTTIAIPWLSDVPSEFVRIAAAIEALRVCHVVEAIPPLIEFLKREDVKRLREDAHAALLSLTGQEHGPYFDPWDGWWREAQGTFSMPPAPVTRRKGPEKGGVTFYGIHTFSDRILFVVDVSGSMDQSSKPGPAGASAEPRIAVARRELAGAINSMNDGERFGVILFNHSVVPWEGGRMVEVAEPTKKKAIRWANDVPPVGGTNLHDALEAAIQVALRSTGRPDVDTIMFLTDGRPTAGKIQDPKAILERVREWNRIANLTIHCVGIGEHDETFLQELARIGKGDYVKR